MSPVLINKKKRLSHWSLALIVVCFGIFNNTAHAKDFVVYEPTAGKENGKSLVFVTGDEEYRSEEALVQLAKILTFRHGFKSTVLFAIDPKDGTINPNVNNTLPGYESLDSADVMILGLRFRQYPDEVMKHFVDAYLSGIPIVAVRTSTHAFNIPSELKSKYQSYSWNNSDWKGGFGRQVLGETWVSHLGDNHREGTLAFPVKEVMTHPLMNGVGESFATSGTYHVDPMKDAKILMRSKILTGMSADSPLHKTKNTPHQPLAWCREHKNETGKTNRVLCTTMGAGPDLLDENLRRLLVNGVFWGLQIEVPKQADVQIVGIYKPTEYGFNAFAKGVKPDGLTMTAEEAVLADEAARAQTEKQP